MGLRLIPITTRVVKRLLQHEEIFLQNIEPMRKLLQNQNQNTKPTDPKDSETCKREQKIRAQTKISKKEKKTKKKKRTQKEEKQKIAKTKKTKVPKIKLKPR